jgi:hypothetical protein
MPVRTVNKRKLRAQLMLREAVLEGRLIRQPCAICGSTTNVHGHHENYSKPLEVQWLCAHHHAKMHNLRMQKEGRIKRVVWLSV